MVLKRKSFYPYYIEYKRGKRDDGSKIKLYRCDIIGTIKKNV